MGDVVVRNVEDADMASIQAIYAWHVENGTGTFEEAPPTLQEMSARRNAVTGLGLPWLAAERAGAVIGYAYAQLYHSRSGWRQTLEDAVYVAHDATGQGIGRMLLGELALRCAALGYREMIAVIGDSANAASIGLHRASGFSDAGLLREVGIKFGRRLDVVLMQKNLWPA